VRRRLSSRVDLSRWPFKGDVFFHFMIKKLNYLCVSCIMSCLHLSFLAVFFCSFLVPQLYAAEDEANIYVHPEGNDTNPGTKVKPKQSVNAALDTIRDFKDKGFITENTQVNVWLRGGRYELKETIGIDFRDSGTAEKPLRISSAPGERAILDGNQTIDLRLFQKPNAEDKALLPQEAHAAVVVATIPEGALSKGLASPNAQMSFGGEMLRVARFPNVGFSYVTKTLEKDKAKAVGTKQEPLGAKIRLDPAPSIDLSQQISELDTGMLKGYLGAEWFKEGCKITGGHKVWIPTPGEDRPGLFRGSSSSS